MSRYCPLSDSQVVYLKCMECGNRVCENENQMFHCIVAGTRTFADYKLLSQKLDTILQNYSPNMIEIIHGGAKGADELASRYAKEKGIRCKTIFAKWNKYGKSAVPIRNEQMHEYVKNFDKRGCVLFWDGKSPGTKNNIALAIKHSTPYRIINF